MFIFTINLICTKIPHNVVSKVVRDEVLVVSLFKARCVAVKMLAEFMCVWVFLQIVTGEYEIKYMIPKYSLLFTNIYEL